jgi:protein-S-isoprenylcysteine O-methyltransferase Ste14
VGNLPFIETIARIGCIACWFVFVLAFVFRKRPPKSVGRKQVPGVQSGILIQGLAYALMWFVQRQYLGSFLRAPDSVTMILSIFAIPVVVASLWMVVSAIQVLGKQWSLAARVVVDHELVTSGPYSIVRNPIYSGMFGMMLGTGFAISHWLAILIAIPVFLAGSKIRVQREESLLRETFGASFDEYASRVPQLIPFSRRNPPSVTLHDRT